MGIDNFVFNGDLDGFLNGFYVFYVCLLFYDFYLVYDKFWFRLEEGEDDEEVFEFFFDI